MKQWCVIWFVRMCNILLPTNSSSWEDKLFLFGSSLKGITDFVHWDIKYTVLPTKRRSNNKLDFEVTLNRQVTAEASSKPVDQIILLQSLKAKYGCAFDQFYLTNLGTFFSRFLTQTKYCRRRKPSFENSHWAHWENTSCRTSCLSVIRIDLSYPY